MFKNIYVNRADLNIQKRNKPFGSRSNFTTTGSSYAIGVPIPKNYNWIQKSGQDDNGTQKIKDAILRPANQGICGNCYAFSTSAVLSDLYSIKYGYDVSPDLSPSYLNINFPVLGGCSGGDPVSALDTMFKYGSVSNRCVDDSICMENESCNGSGSQSMSSLELNKMYETIGKGCYNNNKKQHHFYYPKQSESEPTKAYIRIYPDYDLPMMNEIYQGLQDNLEGFIVNSVNGLVDYPKKWNLLASSQQEARTQIYKNGPGIGLMCVPSNFMTNFFQYDDFINVFDGIFFDSIIWNDDGTFTYSNPQYVDVNGSGRQKGPITFGGGHAVAIIGYGVSDKTIPLMDFKTAEIINVKNIPFWWVRNSWTTGWNPTGGLKTGRNKTEMAGCVKIAMYPFNKVAQFDVPIAENQQYAVPSLIGGHIDGLGGIVFTEAGVPPSSILDISPNDYALKYKNLSDSANYINTADYYIESSRNAKIVVEGGVIKDFMGNVSGTLVTKNGVNVLNIYTTGIIILVSILILFLIIRML